MNEEVKQEPPVNFVGCALLANELSNDFVIKEELKIENEVFQTWINNKFTDYNDLLLEAPRVCNICDHLFQNSFSFLQHNVSHMQVIVKKNQWLFCQRCHEKFLTKFALEKHIKKDHLKLKPHENKLKQCKICDKIFSMKYWYAHMTDVHGLKSYTCDKCGKVFKSAVNFKRHFKSVHLIVKKKVKPRGHFECNKCPKHFKSKDCLQHHVKNCHILMDMNCDVCGAMFKNKPYLAMHIRRVHYDDGHVYPCDICGKIFKAPRRVRIHKQNAHKFISKQKTKVKIHFEE